MAIKRHLMGPISLSRVVPSEPNFVCCDPLTKRTEAILVWDAQEDGVNAWQVMRAQGDPPLYDNVGVVKGQVEFGVCCATTVTFTLTGNTETFTAGKDVVEIYQDDVLIYSKESNFDGLHNAATTEPRSYTKVVTLVPKACGYVFRVYATTVDQYANNDVWWKVAVAVT